MANPGMIIAASIKKIFFFSLVASFLVAKIDGSVGAAEEDLLKAEKSAFLAVLVACPWPIHLN